MITRNFVQTILNDKLAEELAHIDSFVGLSTHVVDGHTFTTITLEEEPSLELDTEINKIVSEHIPTPITYKIEKYIDPHFKYLPIYKIDFTIHLMKNIVLSKSVIKALNGRPEYAEYTLEGVPIARITWSFTDAPSGLYAVKELHLSYYQSDGVLGESYLIEREVIDFEIPNQLVKSIEERRTARSSIVGEIDGVCSGAVINGTGKTLAEVIEVTKPFLDFFRNDSSDFVKYATKDWYNKIIAIDTSQDYEWLDYPVDTNGTTCQQYMLYRLGY